jgi:adenosine kinase
MRILVSGSLAYDRIMDFPGRFSDHILPEKVHAINLSFTVNRLQEKLGGTAGNIAYGLKLLGMEPVIIATIGKDCERYLAWLQQNDINAEGVRVVPEEFTAGAYITTDLADNQITGFNPGSMKHQAKYDFTKVKRGVAWGIIAPGNTQDMVEFAREYKRLGVPYVWDPGQAIPALDADAMRTGMTGARVAIMNDYESELVAKKLDTDVRGFLKLTQAVVVTRGEHGSRVITRDSEVDVPPVPPKQVLDPTGAGDAYRAGLLKGLVEGRPLRECAMLGSTAAAYAVETYGTQEYRYTPEEFARRMRGAFPGARSF